MNLAIFQDVAFDDPAALEDFKCSLQINHDKIAQIMFGNLKFYRTYPLIDNEAHHGDWQQNLQQELNSIFKLLALKGLPDLSGADLNKEDDFGDFLQALVSVEGRINHTLGIT